MSNLVRSARWQGVWVADGEVLKPARGATGGPVPSERSIDLPGYPGGRDRVGNRLTNQRQLDNLGEILLLLAAAARSDRMDVDHWRAAEVTVEAIGQLWVEADSGSGSSEPGAGTFPPHLCYGLRAKSKVAPSIGDRSGVPWPTASWPTPIVTAAPHRPLATRTRGRPGRWVPAPGGHPGRSAGGMV